MSCKNITTLISAFEQNGPRIKHFLKPERIVVGEALFNLFKHDRSPSGWSSYLITYLLHRAESFLGR